MVISPNLALKIWNQTTDPYDHAQLAENLSKIDEHDHTSGKGKAITTGAISDGAITQAKIAAGVSLPSSSVPAGTITSTELLDGGIQTVDLADGSVTNPKLGVASIASTNLQASIVGTTNLVVLPQARVFKSGSLLVINTTTTTLTFDSERWDLGTGAEQHSTSLNTERLTCQVAGLYTIGVTLRWDTNVGDNGVKILLNGVTTLGSRTDHDGGDPGFGFSEVQVAFDYRLAASDWLRVDTRHNSGANRTLQAAEFWMTWRSP